MDGLSGSWLFACLFVGVFVCACVGLVSLLIGCLVGVFAYVCAFVGRCVLLVCLCVCLMAGVFVRFACLLADLL